MRVDNQYDEDIWFSETVAVLESAKLEHEIQVSVKKLIEELPNALSKFSDALAKF